MLNIQHNYTIYSLYIIHTVSFHFSYKVIFCQRHSKTLSLFKTLWRVKPKCTLKAIATVVLRDRFTLYAMPPLDSLGNKF